MSNKIHFLSVIVPAYKQEKTILRDLNNILGTLNKIRYDFELIVVIDGKIIDKTYQIAKSIRNPKVKVIGYKKYVYTEMIKYFI